jgi:hypothetical protein
MGCTLRLEMKAAGRYDMVIAATLACLRVGISSSKVSPVIISKLLCDCLVCFCSRFTAGDTGRLVLTARTAPLRWVRGTDFSEVGMCFLGRRIGP